MGGWQAQGLVRASEVRISAQPLDVPAEAGLAAGQRPGAAAQWSDQLPQGQVEAFDKGRHNASTQTQHLQGCPQFGARAAPRDGIQGSQAVADLDLVQLAVQQPDATCQTGRRWPVCTTQ